MTGIRKYFETMDPETAAKRLLGCELVRTFDAGTVRVRIVETEAYHQSDAASHSFNGRTARTDVMFGPAGRLYVYFTYGMHYCCNVVTGPIGEGSAVLIRAVEPIDGTDLLYENRHKQGSELTNGPAKLCQALHIDKSLNGQDLEDAPISLHIHPEIDSQEIIQTTRIGISKAKEVMWRFYIRGNPYVSQK